MAIKILDKYFDNGIWFVGFMTHKRGIVVYKINHPTIYEYPIKYHTGEIGYDKPETIPSYVKTIVKRAFKALDNK